MAQVLYDARLLSRCTQSVYIELLFMLYVRGTVMYIVSNVNTYNTVSYMDVAPRSKAHADGGGGQ